MLQYSQRRQVPGTVYNHDLTIVELEVLNGQQVRARRDHAVSFAGLAPGHAAMAGGGASPIPAAGAVMGATPTTTAAQGTGAQPADVAVKLIELMKQKR